MINLSIGDVVWSGSSGGFYDAPYHLKVDSVTNLQKIDTGCWCPAEGVEFLRFIGVNVIKDNYFSSGYEANGCYWDREEVPLSPNVQKAYDEFIGNEGNKRFVSKLERYDD